MRTLTRLGCALLAVLLVFVLTPPAQAAVYWSMSRNTGKVSGQFTSNEVDSYHHVAGTMTDYYSYDDCTKLYLYLVGPHATWYVAKTLTRCLGTSGTFDWQGRTSGNRIRMQLCQGTNICTSRDLYLT